MRRASGSTEWWPASWDSARHITSGRAHDKLFGNTPGTGSGVGAALRETLETAFGSPVMKVLQAATIVPPIQQKDRLENEQTPYD